MSRADGAGPGKGSGKAGEREWSLGSRRGVKKVQTAQEGLRAKKARMAKAAWKAGKVKRVKKVNKIGRIRARLKPAPERAHRRFRAGSSP